MYLVECVTKITFCTKLRQCDNMASLVEFLKFSLWINIIKVVKIIRLLVSGEQQNARVIQWAGKARSETGFFLLASKEKKSELGDFFFIFYNFFYLFYSRMYYLLSFFIFVFYYLFDFFKNLKLYCFIDLLYRNLWKSKISLEKSSYILGAGF